MQSPKRILTGVKPTGTPHLGNYLGAVRPGLALAAGAEGVFFVADLHALTKERNAAKVRKETYEVAATWLAAGLDPAKTIVFRQSDLLELPLLAWILSCYTPHGLLERAHAFKAAKDKGEAVNAGVFTYPVLMAADILAFRSTHVPVGQDQKQHVEIARDIAGSFNHEHGDVLVIPEPIIGADTALVPGIDGRKMSKSYDNGINMFAEPKEIKKRVALIVTDSTPLEDPKDPDKCNIFGIYKALATPEQSAELAAKYRAGNFGWGHAKAALVDLIVNEFAPMRERYHSLLASPSEIETIFASGATRARALLAPVIADVRKAVGV